MLNIDLKDFFPSINFGRVRGVFISKPYSLHADAATVLAQICCHDGELPQGAPTSPIISNMICKRLDNELYRLAKKLNYSYTRYGDDITFSTTKSRFSKQVVAYTFEDNDSEIKLGKKLEEIIISNGFEINLQKVRLFNQTSRQEVTGLTVNEKINVRRKFVRQVRAMLYACEKFGEDKAQKEYYEKYDKKLGRGEPLPKFSTIIAGKIAYLKMIRGERDKVYRKLVNKYRGLFRTDLPRLPLNINEELESALWVVKCGSSQGTAFMLKDFGLITCEHVIGSEDEIKVFRSDEIIPSMQKKASVVKCDKDCDLAILRINGVNEENLPSLELGKANLSAGDEITFAGFPNYGSCNKPLINHGCRITGFRNHLGTSRMLINQPMFSGQSGSPAVDINNKVIGIAVTGTDMKEKAHLVYEYELVSASALERCKI